MSKRIIETNVGIQGAAGVDIFDQFARGMRDKNMLHYDVYLHAGIKHGQVLEIGPGPGYVGLEWLKQAPGARLTGLEISPDMIALAERNRDSYGFSQRVSYVQGDSQAMTFPDNQFDGVFSNGSMHEWEHPEKIFNESYRVLKPGGVICITDLRRNINPLIKLLIAHTIKPKEIRPGFVNSVNAAYTVDEVRYFLQKTNFGAADVKQDFMGLTIIGKKV
jgi:ubiquinone/menaquinone biosynthesis C-methylase UbiE